MGADRLQEMFAGVRDSGRAALLPFLTLGIPSSERTVDMFVAMAEAGADGFEVGIPYSDPLMDGPVIQTASGRSLAGGTTLTGALDLVGRITAAVDVPIVVMTYVNPVLRVGVDRFASRVAAAGADGVIVVDVPVDEAGPVQAAVERSGLGMVLFAAPTTDDARLRQVAAAAPAFIYGVADLGVTGVRNATSTRLESLVGRVRGITSVPLVLGVGISTPDQAARAGKLADGVIVGSALVRRVLDAATADAAAVALADDVAALKAALESE